MLLSILIPSKRPEKFSKFISSFWNNTIYTDDIELIVLVDDHHEGIQDNGPGFKIIYNNPTIPVNMSELNRKCYEVATGQWIMLCNDDVVIETHHWDTILKEYLDKFSDELALFWPDDGMFGKNLSCFPIVSRKALELIKFWPQPYYRYKIDDTLFDVFPPNRRIFVPEIKFIHENEANKNFSGTRAYFGDREATIHDNIEWNNELPRREMMKSMLDVVGIKSKVLIGISTQEYARRADFYDYVNMLEKPPGSLVMYCHDRSPATARNTIINEAVTHNCSHILFIDDDMAFKPRSLTQLLEHDKDVVSGLYLGRAYPHQPLIFDSFEDDTGYCRYATLNGDESRLKEIYAAGLGFVLIKTEIFQKLEKPYVRLGELDPAEWCDDIGFFNRVRRAGIKMYCDMECLVGHIGTMIIWPNKQDGKWFAGYDTGKGMVNTPQILPAEMVTK